MAMIAPAPAHDAVDRSDDRLRAGAHRVDQVAGHARELEQPVAVHFGQRADDLVDVAARAEIAARAGHDDALARSRVAVSDAEGIAQLGVAFERQRILALGPVERDRRDPVREVHRKWVGSNVAGSRLTRWCPRRWSARRR